MKNTIKEVAKQAGVSISTVSRVFNNTAFVDEPTKEKVLLAAKALHYSPNQAARSLTKSETRTIGLVLPGIFGEYFSEVLRGMDAVASDADYDIMISGAKGITSKFQKSIRAMSGRVDGLIIMSPIIQGTELRELIPMNIPTVLLNSDEEHPDFDTVNINNSEGAYLAVNHLIRLGHRRIALIKGSENTYDSQQRTEGYRKAIRANGLDQYRVEVSGSFTKVSGYDAAIQLLAQEERPTAIFAANDAMALGAMSALQEHSIAVPNSIAVVGFDDIPMSQFSMPKLTTIRVDLNHFGRFAMERVLAAVRQKDVHAVEHTMLSVELIVRASCHT